MAAAWWLVRLLRRYRKAKSKALHARASLRQMSHRREGGSQQRWPIISRARRNGSKASRMKRTQDRRRYDKEKCFAAVYGRHRQLTKPAASAVGISHIYMWRETRVEEHAVVIMAKSPPSSHA